MSESLGERERILAEATRRFVQVLPVELVETLHAAAVPHWFDAATLAALLDLPLDEASRRYDVLQEVPFVQPLGEHALVLHDLNRRLLLGELWATRRDDYRAWSWRMAEYFQRRADDAAQLEATYHWLVADPERGADRVRDQGNAWNNDFQYHLVYALVRLGMEHDTAGRLAGRARGWVYFCKGRELGRIGENQGALHCLHVARESGCDDNLLLAHCIKVLGDVHFMTSDYAQAQKHYAQALPLYQAIGDRLGEADCIKALGDVHFMTPDYAQAQKHYAQAQLLYQAIGNRQGKANCIKALGDVHFMTPDYAQAQQLYAQALLLYQAIDNRQGEAHCVKALGDVHFMTPDYAQARKRYAQALPLYQAIGDRQGEANCIKALDRADNRQAQREEILRLLDNPNRSSAKFAIPRRDLSVLAAVFRCKISNFCATVTNLSQSLRRKVYRRDKPADSQTPRRRFPAGLFQAGGEGLVFRAHWLRQIGPAVVTVLSLAGLAVLAIKSLEGRLSWPVLLVPAVLLVWAGWRWLAVASFSVTLDRDGRVWCHQGILGPDVCVPLTFARIALHQSLLGRVLGYGTLLLSGQPAYRFDYIERFDEIRRIIEAGRHEAGEPHFPSLPPIIVFIPLTQRQAGSEMPAPEPGAPIVRALSETLTAVPEGARVDLGRNIEQ